MSGQRGSEQRQKNVTVAFRIDESVYVALEAACSTGESPGQLARRLALAHLAARLGLTPRRRQRRPLPGEGTLARILGQLGKIGENLNRVGHAASAGCGIDPEAVAAAARDLRDIRAAIMAALDRE